nr:immunoglobulin heavy chain junction region [Mus musculus]
CARLFAYW